MVRGLSWPEVDSYLHGSEHRYQKDQDILRLLTTMVHNVFADKALSPAELLPFPLLDRQAPKAADAGESLADMRARLEAQNRERLAARAAQPTP